MNSDATLLERIRENDAKSPYDGNSSQVNQLLFQKTKKMVGLGNFVTQIHCKPNGVLVLSAFKVDSENIFVPQNKFMIDLG